MFFFILSVGRKLLYFNFSIPISEKLEATKKKKTEFNVDHGIKIEPNYDLYSGFVSSCIWIRLKENIL